MYFSNSSYNAQETNSGCFFYVMSVSILSIPTFHRLFKICPEERFSRVFVLRQEYYLGNEELLLWNLVTVTGSDILIPVNMPPNLSIASRAICSTWTRGWTDGECREVISLEYHMHRKPFADESSR